MENNILFPAGRMVWGSVDTPQTKDFQGNLLIVKSGQNAGQPTSRYSFGLAIPKGQESGWWETPWGQTIYNTAVDGFRGGETQRPDFSWKVVDGDSPQLNQNNVAWNSKEGYPGNWVVTFATSLPIGRYHLDASTGKPVQILQDGEIVPGYYIEVYGSVAANGNQKNPGVFINPMMVCRVGYGERIVSGPDAQAVGFGGGGVPQGAMQTPPGAMGGSAPAPMQQPAPAPMQQPAPAPMQQPAPAPMQQPAPAPAGAITQHQGVLQPPVK